MEIVFNYLAELLIKFGKEWYSKGDRELTHFKIKLNSILKSRRCSPTAVKKKSKTKAPAKTKR